MRAQWQYTRRCSHELGVWRTLSLDAKHEKFDGEKGQAHYDRIVGFPFDTAQRLNAATAEEHARRTAEAVHRAMAWPMNSKRVKVEAEVEATVGDGVDKSHHRVRAVM